MWKVGSFILFLVVVLMLLVFLGMLVVCKKLLINVWKWVINFSGLLWELGVLEFRLVWLLDFIFWGMIF